jgi:hypothetical protein
MTMAFLDFVNNRQGAQQQAVAQKAQEQKPETAKEMYARQDAQHKAASKNITPEIKAQADRAMATMNKASGHAQSPAKRTAPETGSAPQAQLQNQSRQDKAQSALSPTDGAAGKTAIQDKEKAPEKTPQRAPQTMPRRPPSWER